METRRAVLVAGEIPPALAEACRAVLAYRIARHRGRARESGVVAEFDSPLAALRCALRVRHDMAAIGERLPEGGGLRIGVALTEAEARRLAGLAASGGICVSPEVRDATAGKVDVEFEAVDGGLAVHPSMTGRVFRFKPWTSPARRRTGLALAAAAIALAILAFVVLGTPNG